jgi:hypothetical protein
MKELKEALRRHGERTGSTREATEAWRACRSIRHGEHVEHRTLDEEDG